MVALSDVHRNLLQMLLHEGAYSQQDLLDLFEQCVDSHHGSAKVSKIKWRPGDDEANEATLERMLMTEMNTYLDPIGLKVAKKRHRSTLHYGLVNLRDDDVARAASDLSKREQEFFDRLVVEISSSEQRRLDPILAQNLRLDLPAGAKLGAEEVEACLERLVSSKWIEREDDGSYVLGVRTELQKLYSSREAPPQEQTEEPGEE